MAGLVDKMTEYMNAMAAAKTKADQDAIALDMSDSLREIVAMLSDMNKVHVEASDATIAESAGVATLVDTTKQMLETGEKEAETMASLESLQATTEAKKLAADKSGGIIAQIKNTGSILKDMAKIAAKEYVQNTKVGKLWQSVSKEMKKQGAAKTKVIEGKAEEKGGGVGDVPAPELNSGLIAAQMADAAAKALNPVTLVMTFLTKVLPLILVFGLLLYGFIKGYLGGDVYDFLVVIGTIIFTAFLTYVAWMMVKEGILLAFKFVCEVIKTIASVSADWAEFALVAGIVVIIAAAFILVATMLVIAIVLIGVVIAVAIGAILVSIVKTLIEIGKVFMDAIGHVVDVLVEIAPKLVALAKELFGLIQDALMLIPNFIRELITVAVETFFETMGSLVDHILGFCEKILTTIGNVVAKLFGGIFGSIFGKKDEPKKEEKSEQDLSTLAIDTINANMMIGGEFARMLFEGFSAAFAEAIEPAKLAMENIAESFNMAYTSTMDKINSLFTAVSETVQNQTGILIASIITDLNIITGAFLSLLFGMPIIGWLMGLVGANSFSKAIEPLVENTRQIVDLQTQLLKAATMKQNGYAKSTAITNTVTNSETQVLDTATNTIMPTDGETVESETSTLSKTPSNFVTAQAFNLQMGRITAAMDDVVKAIYATAPENKKGGLFAGWF